MRTFRDARLIARALRVELAESCHDMSDSRALATVAAQFGLPDWKVLAVRPGEAGEGLAAFQSVIPLLRLFDLAKARDFDIGWLGMVEDWERRCGPDLPVYFQVSRSGLILHLTGYHGDAGPRATAFGWMRGLDACHAELAARSNPAMRPGIEIRDLGANAAETGRAGRRDGGDRPLR